MGKQNKTNATFSFSNVQGRGDPDLMQHITIKENGTELKVKKSRKHPKTLNLILKKDLHNIYISQSEWCGFIRFQANFTWISGNFRRFHLLKQLWVFQCMDAHSPSVASVVSGEAVSDDGKSGSMRVFQAQRRSACRYLFGNWGVNYQEYIQVTTGCCKG